MKNLHPFQICRGKVFNPCQGFQPPDPPKNRQIAVQTAMHFCHVPPFMPSGVYFDVYAFLSDWLNRRKGATSSGRVPESAGHKNQDVSAEEAANGGVLHVGTPNSSCTT
jgi:hypothetical protein